MALRSLAYDKGFPESGEIDFFHTNVHLPFLIPTTFDSTSVLLNLHQVSKTSVTVWMILNLDFRNGYYHFQFIDFNSDGSTSFLVPLPKILPTKWLFFRNGLHTKTTRRKKVARKRQDPLSEYLQYIHVRKWWSSRRLCVHWESGYVE